MKFRKTAGLALALLITSVAQADVSSNLGFASDYYYRGIFQAPNSVSAGLDFESSGFYAGTWAADVKDGLEVDGYFGYGSEIGDLGYSIGYTGYFYTGDFDDTYQELNFGTSYGFVAVDVALGQYDNFAGPTLDYTYYSLTVTKEGFYARYGGFAQDFAGEYFEAGFGTTVVDIDVGIAAIFANKDLVGTSDESLVLSISKSFDLK
jgi:uncharacterized protein (TIGR02001 family)